MNVAGVIWECAFARFFFLQSQVQKHKGGLPNCPEKHVVSVGSSQITRVVPFLRSSKNMIFCFVGPVEEGTLPEILEETWCCFG